MYVANTFDSSYVLLLKTVDCLGVSQKFRVERVQRKLAAMQL